MKYVIIGDSNTYGFDPSDYLGRRYAKVWTDYLNIEGCTFENAGVNGQRVFDIVNFIPNAYDSVFIMLGTNDILQNFSVSTIIKEMKDFLSNVNGKAVIICPVIIEMKEFKEKCIALNDLYQKLGVPCIPSIKVDMAYDGIHFSQKGHEQFGIYINEEIKKLLHK